LRRIPDRGEYDREAINEILDEAFICHIGFFNEGTPYVIPTGYAIPLNEVSAKVRTGPPVDDEEDHALDVWAGIIPLRLKASSPVDDPLLREGIEPSAAISNYDQRVQSQGRN
jgi:hypothetical protein